MLDLLICRQLEADNKSLSVLPSPLKQLKTSTAVSAYNVSSVTSVADSSTVSSHTGQYVYSVLLLSVVSAAWFFVSDIAVAYTKLN